MHHTINYHHHHTLTLFSQTCNGCIDLNVQRLCYGAQQCTIARCIGTLTNQNRPLCGIGQTGQAIFTTNVVLVNAAWNIFTETLSHVFGLALEDQSVNRGGIQIKWIDDGFYSAICSAKDATATFISIVTSVINYVVQSVTAQPLTYLDMNAQKIDSNFQAMFTMILSSLNNFLNQIVLGIFYPILAMQKAMICQTNSVLAIVKPFGVQVTIGIPEIQEASDAGVGRCLTAYHTENTNTIKESGNEDSFESVASNLVKDSLNSVLTSFLEVVKHPLDAGFTWLIGVVSGLQDFIQTLDMANCKLPNFFMKVIFYHPSSPSSPTTSSTSTCTTTSP